MFSVMRNLSSMTDVSSYPVAERRHLIRCTISACGLKDVPTPYLAGIMIVSNLLWHIVQGLKTCCGRRLAISKGLRSKGQQTGFIELESKDVVGSVDGTVLTDQNSSEDGLGWPCNLPKSVIRVIMVDSTDSCYFDIVTGRNGIRKSWHHAQSGLGQPAAAVLIGHLSCCRVSHALPAE